MAALKAGIILCSRRLSSRIQEKPFQLLQGTPLIRHLVLRLTKGVIPVYVAVPPDDMPKYESALGGLPALIVAGSPEDPLKRMADVARAAKLDIVVRVCHDKLFVHHAAIARLVNIFTQENLDYLYSSQFIPGTGFEVISNEVLQDAARRFKNVEHVSYAVRAVATAVKNIHLSTKRDYRLLIDYPKDLEVIEQILQEHGPFCTLSKAIQFLDANPHVAAINRLPKITVYTCAYNAERFIEKCMNSVIEQHDNLEYILVDDRSGDDTLHIMQQFQTRYPGAVSVIKNKLNLGLASSSNIALSRARGEYVIRMDADDYFIGKPLADMVEALEASGAEALYPAYFKGDMSHIERGFEFHHAGGALFNTRALNFVKFTDGLRHWDSYDLFKRAQNILKVAYYDEPTFFYSQRPDSLSANNTQDRIDTRNMLDAQL